MSEAKLDPATIMELRPIHEIGNEAIRHRGAFQGWCVAMAVNLGVECDNFQSENVGEQYEELRCRISDKLDSLRAKLASAEAQAEQYRLETHRWADASRKDREERDEFWRKIRAAEARAERAEGALSAMQQRLRSFIIQLKAGERHCSDARDSVGIATGSALKTIAGQLGLIVEDSDTTTPQRTDGESSGQICGLCDKPKPCKCLMELESDAATMSPKEGGGE